MRATTRSRRALGATGVQLVAMCVAAAIVTSWPQPAAAQGHASDRIYLLDFHIGQTVSVGGRGRRLVADNGAAGVAFAFQATRRSWGWVSFDFRPTAAAWEEWYYTQPQSDLPPSVGMYAITGGGSWRFGPAIGRSRWLPLEVGLGAGATRVEIVSNGSRMTPEFPAESQFEDVFAAGLLSSLRWRPTAVARLRLSLPVGSAFRLGAGASLLATHLGDVRLWDGGWEQTGTDSRYRPTSRIWSFGTVVTAPITVTLSLKL